MSRPLTTTLASPIPLIMKNPIGVAAGSLCWTLTHTLHQFVLPSVRTSNIRKFLGYAVAVCIGCIVVSALLVFPSLVGEGGALVGGARRMRPMGLSPENKTIGQQQQFTTAEDRKMLATRSLIPIPVMNFKEAIGNNRFLTASYYKNELMVHIRQYAEDGDKTYPTKKGVSFNASAWARFRACLDELDRNVQLMKANQPVDIYQHLGGRYYASISNDFRCVNIRRYFLPPNSTKERPTRSGIALRLDEWASLLLKIEMLHEYLPELKNATTCYSSLDHANQLGALSCTQCNPFGL